MLYLLYTNEIPLVTCNKTVQFADDTSLLFSIDRGIGLERVIFGALDSLNRWFEANNLKLNVSKTQLLKFSFWDIDPVSFSNNNFTLKTSQSASFLGVVVDSRLDWRLHIAGLLNVMSSYCYALKILSQNVNSAAAVVAYHAHIHSRLRYGIVLWGNASDVSDVVIMQKRCLRNIFGMRKTDSCRNLFKKLSILTVIGTYIYEASVFVKTYPELFQLCIREHNYETRQRDNLIDRKPNFSYIQKNAHSSVIKIFNKIPLNVRQLPLKEFKYKLRRLLNERTYYSMDEFYSDRLN